MSPPGSLAVYHFNMAEGEGAKTVKVQHSPAAGKAILRIKRKRSADPADLLLVSHGFKKTFTEEDHKLSSCGPSVNAVQRVFRLAGTVSKSNDEALSPELLTKLSKNYQHKSKVKVNPKNELTVDAINEKLRESKKLARQTSRYKVISKHREVENDTENDEIDAATQEMFKLYQMYDAVVLDDPEYRNNAAEESENEDGDPAAILCNSVKMIREKLRIDEGSKKSNLEILEQDFVYDVYCAEDNYGALSEVLDIVHLNESELATETLSDGELDHYDDEDDSNDESNWRNDYPDEDEWDGSSDEEGQYRNEDFDFGYDKPSRRMFSRELSSDDEQDYTYGYGRGKDDYNYEVVDQEDY